jgi:sulfur carrier protein
MKLNINGKAWEIEKSLNLIELIEHFQLKVDQVVVELNQTVPEKKTYAQVYVKDGDKIELIKFLGGG